MELLEGVLGGVIGAQALALVKNYLQKHGGIAGVVAELENSGLAQQVKSWVSTGPNHPITGAEVEAALGADLVRELSEKSGMAYDKILEVLAKDLPTVVDKATPEGKLP